MGMPTESYHFVIVESYHVASTSGKRGSIHIRPARDQMFGQELEVRCPREMVNIALYPLGTKFRIRVKLTDKEGSKPFLHAPHQWGFELVSKPTV